MKMEEKRRRRRRRTIIFHPSITNDLLPLSSPHPVHPSIPVIYPPIYQTHPPGLNPASEGSNLSSGTGWADTVTADIVLVTPRHLHQIFDVIKSTVLSSHI